MNRFWSFPEARTVITEVWVAASFRETFEKSMGPGRLAPTGLDLYGIKLLTSTFIPHGLVILSNGREIIKIIKLEGVDDPD
jgi:hypothetical protein